MLVSARGVIEKTPSAERGERHRRQARLQPPTTAREGTEREQSNRRRPVNVREIGDRLEEIPDKREGGRGERGDPATRSRRSRQRLLRGSHRWRLRRRRRKGLRWRGEGIGSKESQKSE